MESDWEFVERIGNTPVREIGVRDGARLFALARRGAHLCDTARSIGWPDDDGEGAFEFVVRCTREVALEDARRGAAMQWRPISEAPKDGTPVLLRDDAEDEELDTIYFAMAGIWTHGKWHFPGHGGWQPSPWFVPLRWLPLPPPPKGAEK